MAFSTRVFKAPAGVAAPVGIFPSNVYSAEETAFRALAPSIFLNADERYCKGLQDGASVADFRWRCAVSDLQFKPFGTHHPSLVTRNTRKGFRFGFGDLTNGSDGRGGQLIEVDETPIMQRGESYTLAYLFRVPIPMTEGNVDGTIGGLITGGRVSANWFRSQIIDSNGRFDHRHATTYGAISTEDHRTGVPVAAVIGYNAVASTVTCRINGAAVPGYTDVPYTQDFAATDAALAWMIGGYGDTSTLGGTQLDICVISKFSDRCITAAGQGSALATLESYLLAEKAKFTV